MAKFSGSALTASSPKAPIQAVAPTRTFEGGPAWEMDDHGHLFLLAATNMVGEDTFYEKASNRDKRFTDLIAKVTASDPEWVKRFAAYLRGDLKMRSASVVLACEYVAAGGPEGRSMVNAVCQRADEPGEVIGYWLAKHNRAIPQAIKRGVGDAVRRLYTERNVLKWDSSRHGVSFADVIELVHPTPKDGVQGQLFKYLLDQAHHNDGLANIEGDALGMILTDASWIATPEPVRRSLLRSEGLPDFWAWERLAGWLPGGMDAEAWEAVIPNMGVMALIRNLRNFDGKGISDKAIDMVIEKITDAEQVERSRIFPYQVWTAYREAPSDNWKRALGKTLDLSMPNVPDLGEGTMVFIDTSGSMDAPVSGRSTISRLEVAAVMATALQRKHEDTLSVIFGHTSEGFRLKPGTSTLNAVQAIMGMQGRVGHSTMLHTAIRDHFDPTRFKRAVVFTDDQAHDSGIDVSFVPKIFTYDLGGYGRSTQKNGSNGRYIFGGYSDATLAGIAAIESIGHTGWPF